MTWEAQVYWYGATLGLFIGAAFGLAAGWAKGYRAAVGDLTRANDAPPPDEGGGSVRASWPRPWLDVAIERGARVEPDGSITGGALEDVGIAIINGCPGCGATVSPGNSYQCGPDDPYAWCADCSGALDEPAPNEGAAP